MIYLQTSCCQAELVQLDEGMYEALGFLMSIDLESLIQVQIVCRLL